MAKVDWQRYVLEAGKKVKLDQWDPQETQAWEGDKDSGKAQLGKLTRKLEELQELLYAEGKRRLLVILQGMDTSGKDGVIRHVFEGVNPQGVRVASFKAPTAEELAHDYLWRIHRHTPAKGEIVIFNRSHYEDVLIVRVHDLAPPEVWSKRYDQIRDFERMLAEEGVTILKFFLHINRAEQRERLLARLDEPAKNWKFNPGDLEERKLWLDYQHAYEVALERTTTEWAPWILVPSNRKWYRNLVIGAALVDTLKGFDMHTPQPEEDLEQYRAALLSGG